MKFTYRYYLGAFISHVVAFAAVAFTSLSAAVARVFDQAVPATAGSRAGARARALTRMLLRYPIPPRGRGPD